MNHFAMFLRLVYAQAIQNINWDPPANFPPEWLYRLGDEEQFALDEYAEMHLGTTRTA